MRFTITVYSKRKCFIKLGLAIGFAIVGAIIIYGMLLENDLDIVVAFGLLMGSMLLLTFLPLSAYYLIKALKATETIYTCGYRKCRLDEDMIIRNEGNDTEVLMRMVRKKKSAN